MINQLGTFFSRGCFVRDELAYLFATWRQPCQIQMDSAQVCRVVTQLAGRYFDAIPFLSDQFVDLVPGFGFGFLVTAAVSHHRQRCRRICSFVASENWGFAAPQCGQHSPGGRRCDFGVTAFDERFLCHVAAGPIRVMCNHANLLVGRG